MKNTLKNWLFFLPLSIGSLISLKAQGVSEVLRYSSVGYGGTARSMGVGNSMSALGGDFATIGINPAGLATFRNSDFTISGGYFNSLTSSRLAGNGNLETDESNNKSTLNNLGLVIASKPWGGSKWQTSNFAVGLNRLADFNRTVYYSGYSPGSLVTVFKNQANVGFWDDFGSSLAYQSEALYDSTINGQRVYFSDFDGRENSLVRRIQTVNTTGRINELVFSYAGNYDDKLYLGATMGIPMVRHTVDNNYTEDDPNQEIPYFNSLSFIDRVNTEGAGINLKIGAIYRPIQALRIGLAVHTPTVYALTETHTADMGYNYTTNSGRTFDNSANSPEGTLEYQITTPWRGVGSVGVIVGKKGFISADVEYIDYSTAKLRFTTPDSIGQQRKQEIKSFESEVNSAVASDLKSAMNIRLGGEVAFDVLRLRAGFNLMGLARQNETGFRNAVMLGVGFRGKHVFLDLSYRNEQLDFSYQPYNAANVLRQPEVSISNRQSSIIGTLGFKF